MKELDLYIEYLKSNRKSPHTLRNYRGNIEQFLNILNISTLEDLQSVDSDDIVFYKNSLNVSDNSVHTKMVEVCSFYKYLVKKRKVLMSSPIDTDDIPTVKKRVKNIPSTEQIKALLKHYKRRPTEYTLLNTFVYTGMRFAGCVTLKKENIRADKIVVIEKGDKERQIPISQEFYEFLMDFIEHKRNIPAIKTQEEFQHLKDVRAIGFESITDYPTYLTMRERDKDLLFLGDNGFIIQNGNLNASLKRAAKKVGIPPEIDVNVHIFRHYFGTKFYENGGDMRVLQEIMGHSSMDTTMMYAQMSEKRLQEAKKFMPNFL